MEQCKKYLINSFIVSILFVIFCFNSYKSVSASDGYVCNHGFHTFGDYTLNGGVGNYGYTDRYYWVDSSFSNTYVTYINKAVSEWVHTTDSIGVTTSISIKKTTTRKSSVFDYIKGTLDNGVLGKTSFYKHGGILLNINNQGALNENYSYSYIKLDTSNLNSIPSDQRRATCAHELGHAMGLSHHQISSSIMCQYGSGRTTAVPSKNDLSAINHLYN
ncbi:MAG: matrixin family metalloprotease [Lachnospiraceae bacterium]|jgi:predicted Zn-dependent protease|nr:matrixin family metalloprotease [Lachnospiraceae bacterium]MEE3460488.1 matrixin family metalloprotease [Lachnospiraceae bacterium]